MLKSEQLAETPGKTPDPNANGCIDKVTTTDGGLEPANGCFETRRSQMADNSYDIVVVGGGLGGAALAKTMAERGMRVLVVERERQFRDRVRGEGLSPWGAAEAERLGIYDLLLETCAFERPWVIGFGPDRDLVATTPQQLPLLTFYHPEMQEVLLGAAAEAGAEVRRGAVVRAVALGSPAEVQFESEAGAKRVTARLVVGADGRGSAVRTWGQFPVRRDPERLVLAGVLLEGIEGPRDGGFYFIIKPEIVRGTFVAPQRAGRARVYLVYRAESDYRLQGREALPQLLEESVRCGVPAEFYAHAKMAGPLASFSGADNWVEHPYANGIALIGDAAATTDPSWGQGLSLTLRDVRVLRDALLADDHWYRAGHAYATEHDRYVGVVHTAEDWLTEFFYATSAEAEARRARAMPLIEQDAMRVPDHILSGPEQPLDEAVRARFFGEA